MDLPTIVDTWWCIGTAGFLALGLLYVEPLCEEKDPRRARYDEPLDLKRLYRQPANDQSGVRLRRRSDDGLAEHDAPTVPHVRRPGRRGDVA